MSIILSEVLSILSFQTSRPKKDSGVFSPVTKRDYCAQELVETEKNYVDALNMIHKNFYLPLRGFVPKDDRFIETKWFHLFFKPFTLDGPE